MNDGDELDDGALQERLRTGFEALAAEAGGPPPFPERAKPVARSPRRAYAVAAAVVLLALVGGVLAWAGRDKPSDERIATGPEEGGDRPLLETRWWLMAATQDGLPVEVAAGSGIGVQFVERWGCEGSDCPMRPAMIASDACNGVSRRFTRAGDTIELGQAVGASTLMACTGPLPDLLVSVFGGDRLRVQVRGDELLVRAGGAVLTYRAADGPFAPTVGEVVDEGGVGATSYRLVWEQRSLQLQASATLDGYGRGGTGLGEDPGRINVARSKVDGRPYLLAIVPAEAARVVYEPTGGPPQEMEVHDVGSDTSAVVGQFVDEAPKTWLVVAYAADGVELHRTGVIDRTDFGAGLPIEAIVSAAGLQDCCTSEGAREAFTASGVAMSIGSAPLIPEAPRKPSLGLDDAGTVNVAPDGTAVTGVVRDLAALRFDCAETRYEVRAPLDAIGALLAVAPLLSAAAGCDRVHIAD